MEQPAHKLKVSFISIWDKVRETGKRGERRHFKFLVDTIQNAIWIIHPSFLSVLKININGSLELIWQLKVNINNIEDQ